MKKITGLSEKQESELSTFREKWLKIGLNTEKVDRKKAEQAVIEVYKTAGLKTPKIKVWLDSPYAGSIGSSMLAQVRAQVGAQVWDQVRAQVGAQVGDQVRAQVRDQVRAQVRAQVGAQVWAQVRAQVGAQVWDQVRAQVGAQVWAQVRAQVWDQVRAQVYRCGYGLHDAYWLGFYDFFRKYLDTPKINGLIELSQNCGWWWPFENAVVLTERPCFISRDDQNRLHCEDRMALEYPDGWGLHVWHGVRVPSEIITSPNDIKPKDITGEQNQEIRRIMLERYGVERFLTSKAVTVLGTDNYGQLIECSAIEDDSQPARFIKVKDGSSERQYFLRVPPGTKSAHEGAAWTFNMTKEEYRPLKEA
jgi:hypothetical protein